MVRLDQHAPAPVLDAAARARLVTALDRPPVVAASLIGSHATGRVGPLSDVDIAVWLEPGAPAQTRFELAARTSQALGTDAVDLVVLNGAPPLLQHRAMRDQVRLLERDHDQRVRFETVALLTYLDTEPLRKTLAEGVRRRLAEGRFGRR